MRLFGLGDGKPATQASNGGWGPGTQSVQPMNPDQRGGQPWQQQQQGHMSSGIHGQPQHGQPQQGWQDGWQQSHTSSVPTQPNFMGSRASNGSPQPDPQLSRQGWPDSRQSGGMSSMQGGTTSDSYSRDPNDAWPVNQVNSRTPLIDHEPVGQPHPFVQAGSMQGAGGMQTGPYQSQGGMQTGAYQSNHGTAVPPTDGLTVVNGHPNQGMHSNYASQIGAQERMSGDWRQDNLASGLHGHPGMQNTGYPATLTSPHDLANVNWHQFLIGMEGHTRLLQLMHDAFSAAQNQVPAEMMQPKRPFKNFGVLDEIYKFCGFSERSPAEMEKLGLETEIKRIYRRKAAAGELLDAIEREVMEMEKIIEDRRLRRERVLRSIGVTSGFGLASCCNNCCDIEDGGDIDRRVAGKDAGQVELRWQLRQRLEEVQQDLQERTQELNSLKHEMGVASRDLNVANSTQDMQHQLVANNAAEARERMKRHFAAQFATNLPQLAAMIFLSWKTHTKTMATKSKALKQGAMTFARGFGAASKAICFASWKELFVAKKDKAGKRQERMMTFYAAKFVGPGASKKLCFEEWWKFVKDTRAQDRIIEAEARAHRDVGDAMEARYAQLSMHAAMGHNVKAKVTIISGAGLGAQSHSIYVVCQIPGKSAATFQTEAVKSIPSRTGIPSRNGVTHEALWNTPAHELVNYEAGDELSFNVFIKGGILHTMHLQHDESLGTYTLKASQFFPNGFEGILKLQKPGKQGKAGQVGKGAGKGAPGESQYGKGMAPGAPQYGKGMADTQDPGGNPGGYRQDIHDETDPELKVKVEVVMVRVPLPGASTDPDSSHAQNAADAAARAQAAQQAAEAALSELQSRQNQKGSCSGGKCVIT